MKKNALVHITCLLFLVGGLNLKAASGVWSSDADGNWSDPAKWLGGTMADGDTFTADFSTINLTADRTVTLDAAHTLSGLKFGDALPNHNWTLSGANTLTLGTTPAISVVNQTATISSVIAGTAFTKTGLGTLVLNGSAVNTFTGAMTNKAGALTVDFSNLATPANLINSGVTLALAGGTLNINGAASGATSQAFGSSYFGTGGNAINVVNNGASASLSLGAMTYAVAAPVQFFTPGATPATITTTTAGGGPLGLLWSTYSTYGLSDWASTSLTTGGVGTSPYTIKGLSSVTGGYVTTMGGTGQNQNMDLQANYTAGSANVGTTTIRFNTPAANNVNAHGKWLVFNAVLVTPNMGAVNASISAGNWYAVYNTSAATEWVVQNNTAGYFINTGGLINDKGGAGALTYVQSGSGTVVMPGTSTVGGGTGVNANNYTGQSYLNGGSTLISVDADLGAPATAAMVNLNGGRIVGNATVALDNAGANPRPITLLGNGGGLAATAGNTLTVDGQIGSAAGTGPLVIGIPASAANGNVAGLLPGTGSIANGQAVDTANTTPVFATGTVKLTYPNGANGNFFYGGVVITAGATLNINSQYALGGANYSGLTFNNGTLQYNTALATGAAGMVLDISGAPVTFTGNGTIDVNGQTIAYANSIGNGGSGSLSVTNSGVAGVGALLLNGGSSYTGGTTVNSGATLGGTGTLAGNVTWRSGSYAAFTQGSPMTVSGTVTLNNPTVAVTASGLTTGTYTLLTATGGITGGSTVNPNPSGTGIVASGYAGTVAISGNTVVLNVTQLGVSATWTDGLGDQKWSEAGNWSGGVPHSPGDSASFGTGGVGSPVNLDANETIGGLTFNNASSYTITGANTLTLDNTTHPVAISVTAGTANGINTPVSLNGNVTATVNPGDSLAFGGSIANKTSAETLTLGGGGTTILSVANSFGPVAGAVGTTLNGITLQVGNNSALGAGDLSVTANSTLQAGAAGLNLANNIAVATTRTAAVDNGGNTLTLSGAITGSGALAAGGAGTLVLGGANNTYTGGTTINAGTVSISSDGAAAGNPASLGVVPAAVAPNDIIFNGGDLLATASLTLHTNRGIGIGAVSPANSAVTTALIDAASGQTLEIDGVIASAGNAGTNNLTVNSGSGHTGTVLLDGANTFNGTNAINAGIEQLGNPLALQNSTLNYNNQGGVLSLGALTAATLGGLTGMENLNLVNDSSAPVALTIGNNNTTATYTGILGDTGSGASLIKTGTGVITIGSGASGGATYTGVTTVNNGTLMLGGITALNTSGNLDISATAGAGTVILADAASASFSGMIQLSYAAGAAYPFVSALVVKNSAILNAASLSFGDGSRLPSSSVTVQDSGTLSVSGAFDLNDNIGSTAQNSVVNLNGGTLAVGNFISTSASATHQATINLNGGVLQANASDPSPSTFLPALTGLTVNVLTNGVTINPNGNTITIAAALSGAGGLTNIGTGTLTLANANTYAGATIVSNGATLNVINTTGSATGTNTVTVNSTGTLSGTGLIAGNVIWQPGALATFSAGASPSPLTVGVVTLNNNVVTVDVPGGTPLTVGSYTLMHYTAAGSTGVFNSTPIFTGAGVASGMLSSISTSGGVVILTISPNVTAAVWDVDADGNWTDAPKWSSNPAVPGFAGDAATLGFGTALRTVTLNANESLGYLSLTNASSFVVANAGHTLTFDNNNTGAFIAVGGGTSNLIQTAIALKDNTTIALNSGNALTIAGPIANSPSVTETLSLNGAGTLNLPNANTYGPAAGSIGTILSGGILRVGNNSSLGAGDVNVAGVSTLQSGAANLILTNNVALGSGATAWLDDNGNNLMLGGVVSGSGILKKIGSGTVTLTNNNSYSGALIITNGTLVLSGDNSGASAPITNSATLRLAHPNAAAGGSLTLNNNSTLQLRADADTTFTPPSLALQNASDTVSFDASPLTSATGQTLTLGGTLAFPNNSSQTIKVAGNSTYTLSLGAVTLTSSTGHNPYLSLNVNTVPNGASLVLASLTVGNWGDYLNLTGGGKITITGNLANTSNGNLLLYVNGGTMLTLLGTTTPSVAADGYRYCVADGTLVLDNSSALINNTGGTGLGTSYFILGAATNVFTLAGTFAPPAGVLVTNNNNFNAAVYLGDANNAGGGLSVGATVTNYVSDGDAGFVNSGVFTIGGQNTSGVNTYANPIILGWTPNRGKSVTLVAATGGEVDFANILANGTDQFAGVTVGDATHTGLVKFTGVNTYRGNTAINGGTLEVANANFSTNSTVTVTNGATLQLDFAGANIVNALVLNGLSQPAGTYNSGNTALITGSGSLQVVPVPAPIAGFSGTPTSGVEPLPVLFTDSSTGNITNWVWNFGDGVIVTNTSNASVNHTYAAGSYTVSLTVNGFGGTSTGTKANYIVVAPAVNTDPATVNFKAVNTGTSLQFSWAPDHKGWQLYTNAIGLNATGSWFPISGSASVTNETITINPAKPNVFFQLRYP